MDSNSHQEGEKSRSYSSHPAGFSSLSDEVFVFLHLHKTGGTSIQSLIKQLLPSAKFAPTDRSGRIELHSVDNPEIQVIAGHITARDLRLVKRPKVVTTVLREPIDRILSHIYFIKSYTNGHLETFGRPELVEMKVTPVQELIYRETFYQRFSNYYTKRLDPEFDQMAYTFSSHEPSLGRAIEFIKSCKVIGTTGNIMEFARGLVQLTKVRQKVFMPTQNARRSMQQLSGFEKIWAEELRPRDIDYLEMILSLDRKLYNYVLVNSIK